MTAIRPGTTVADERHPVREDRLVDSEVRAQGVFQDGEHACQENRRGQALGNPRPERIAGTTEEEPEGAPERMKQMAVFAFMLIQSARMLVSASSDRIQPAITTMPTAQVRTAIYRAMARNTGAACVGGGRLIEGIPEKNVGRRMPVRQWKTGKKGFFLDTPGGPGL